MLNPGQFTPNWGCTHSHVHPSGAHQKLPGDLYAEGLIGCTNRTDTAPAKVSITQLHPGGKAQLLYRLSWLGTGFRVDCWHLAITFKTILKLRVSESLTHAQLAVVCICLGVTLADGDQCSTQRGLLKPHLVLWKIIHLMLSMGSADSSPKPQPKSKKKVYT